MDAQDLRARINRRALAIPQKERLAYLILRAAKSEGERRRAEAIAEGRLQLS